MPAVSYSFTGMPPMAAVSETRSRVVPGISVTMARSCSSRRLNRLLLPTLGRPTMASVRPLAHQPAVLEAGGQPADALRDRRQAAQNLRGRRHADVVLGEIDARFEQRDQFQQAAP